MSNALQVFNNSSFGTLRTLNEDGDILFCATDVAKNLKYSNPRKAIADHCRYVTKRDVPHPQSADKTLEMNFIPESDLYRLIIHSHLESAERFEKWVFDDVLPSIRETGSYSIPDSELKEEEDKDDNEDLRLQLAEERLFIQRRNADARNAMALQRVVENPAYPLNKEQRQLLVYEIARLTTGKELELLEPILSKTYYAASFVAEELGINLHSLIKIARQGGLISDEDKINKYGLWKLYKGKNKSHGDTLQFYFSEIGREKVKELCKEHKWGFK